MKKYYIPTSTLNFNNILSSESISPKAFYDNRGFGYSRWASIPENPFANAIVLYDSLCYFERPKSDIEDHPLLIEVLLDEAQLKQAEGFLYSDATIYLAPTTTRFFFYTERDRDITLSMSESSLETKMMRLYGRQIQLIQSPSERYTPISSSEPTEFNKVEIEKDARINRMKGMLYGYYIGSILSSDLDIVKHLNNLREIHNIFAAILSSSEKRPTAYQNERLNYLFECLNEQTSDYKNLYEIIDSSVLDTKNKVKKIITWISTRRSPIQFEDKNVWLSYLQYTSEKDENENQAITWIKQKVDDVKKHMYANVRLLNPDDDEIIVIDNYLTSLKNSNIVDKVEKKLCLSWVNEVLSNDNTSGKISTYREELAKNITLKAKEIYQSTWENCYARAYLNDLRRHIAGEEFKYDWNNGLLSSIAAVLIAGDDWEKLLRYMQSKEMTDYKLAFAFYGTLNGFANLTRDFSDILFEQDKYYVWNVYKELYGQLHGKGIPNAVNNDTAFIPEGKRPVMVASDNNGSTDTYATSKGRAIVEAIKKHPKYNQKKHQVACTKILEGDISDWDSIKELCKWKGIIEEIRKRMEGSGSVAKKGKSKKESMSTPTLFNLGQDVTIDNKHSQGSIIFDRNAEDMINRCPSLLPQIKKSVLKLFREFQMSYQSGYYSMHPEQYKRNNSDVINHFNKWCFSQKNKDALPWTEENRNSMDGLKQYLLHSYCD